MSKKRRQHSAQFKFQVALAATAGTKTITQLASEYQVHPNQIGQWKRHLVEGGALLFTQDGARRQRDQEALETDLYEPLGRLKMELEWVKKKLPDSRESKRAMIDLDHPTLSLRQQCALLGLARSTWYDQPALESPLNLDLMRLLDEQYLKTPFYGWPRMTAYWHRLGYPINHKRVQRLMQIMGLCAMYPTRKTSHPAPEHRVYPYLLRGLEIVHPNQVWSADIPYVPMVHGFMSLVAILDWDSRSVLAYRLSNTLDSRFCIEALGQALALATPAIFNTDQGVQFTARSLTTRLEEAGAQISMDGRGRVFDNIFVERLWRSVKYEDIYLNDYPSVPELDQGLQRHFSFYHHERPHQSLGYRVPAEVHCESV